MATVLHRLAAWADSDPNSPAQSYKVGDQWKAVTSREFRDRVYWLALFLESRGLNPQDIGTIFSYNCPQWVQMDLAPLLLGAKSAGIYPNSTAKDILYILNHTESRFFAVQNKEYFKKIVGDQGDSALPDRIQLVLVFDGDESISSKAVGFEKAIAEGKKLASQAGTRKFSEYLNKVDPQAGAFMIYTSGTTGQPKGAILSHENLVFSVDAVVRHWRLPMGNGSLFSFLPLCHVAEKLQNVGAGICQRYNTYYCTKFENVSVELPQVQPTLVLCVPRVWEKMMEGVLKKVDHGSEVKKAMAKWAFATGTRISEAKYAKRMPAITDWLQWKVADRLVLSKVRHALGLSKAEALASGAATLAPSVSLWFRSIGLEINEDYGQTESTGVICMTKRDVDCLGTVGAAVDGLEVKIAEDGEILTRGKHVFIGYFRDDVSTAQALDQSKWLHTGDLGEFDSRGFVRIRGRKKEILKTSGGKMVAPLPIEEALKSASVISQVCMVGDGRKYLSALITLSESKLAELAKANGTLKGVIITAPHVVNEIKQHIDQLNSTLPTYEQIKKFAILSREFSIADGEMTPTLKMKRNVIEDRYQQVIQQFYESA